MANSKLSRERRPADLLEDPQIRALALELALQQSKAGYWVWDLETGRLAWSREVYAIFGIDRVELNLEDFLKLVHPEDIPRAQAAWTKALADGSALRFDFRRALPDGGVKWLTNYGKARFNAKGIASQFIGTVSERESGCAGDDWLSDSTPNDTDEPLFRPIASVDQLKRLQRDIVARPADDVGRARLEQHLLELLLRGVAPPVEARKTARSLIQRFGATAAVLEAPEDALSSVDGVRAAHLVFLDVVRLAMEWTLRPTREPVRFESASSIVNYLRIAQGYKTKEILRVLFLDRSRHIIGDEIMQEGTVDYTPVNVREIIKRALELSAASLILAHNHPSGDPTPSSKDILTTLKVVEAARTLGIAVDDHIVLSKHGHTSMRALKMIPEPDIER
ncbi:RadC family protein [Methylocystis sp. S23]|jgi:DNA repair protein RadC